MAITKFSSRDFLEVEFVNEKLTDRFAEILQESITVKGSTAFWTVHPKRNHFTWELCAKLQNDESFYCIDINKPTSVENLIDFVLEDARVYFYVYRTEEGPYSFHKGLLHSKLALCETDKGYSYVIIGSHNLTLRAIDGFNRETSLILKVQKGSKTEKTVLSYLEKIKELCLPISFSEKWVYKILQTKGELEEINMLPMIPLLTYHLKTFDAVRQGDNIQMISFSDDYYDQINKIGRHVCIQLQDVNGQSKVLICRVDKPARIEPSNRRQSADQGFGARFYFYSGLTDKKHRGLITPSVLFPKKEIDSQMLFHSNFHVELVVIDSIDFCSEPKGSLNLKKIRAWEKIDDEDLRFLEIELEKIYNQYKSTNNDLFNESSEISLENSFLPSIMKVNREVYEDILESSGEKSKFDELQIERIRDLMIKDRSRPYIIDENYLAMFKEINDTVGEATLDIRSTKHLLEKIKRIILDHTEELPLNQIDSYRFVRKNAAWLNDKVILSKLDN